MCARLFLLIPVCLLFATAISAQRVIETESRIVFTEKTAELSLVLESRERNANAKIDVELIDAAGTVRAASSPLVKLRFGKQAYKVTLPIGDLLKTAGDDIVWFRLRYKVAGQAELISLSELLKDDFEIRVSAFERVVPGQTFRARVRALHPLTKASVKRVQVEGTLKLDLDTEADEDELTIKANGQTNSDGFVILDFKIPDNIKLEDNGDLLVRANKGGITREIDESLDSDDQEGSVILTSDKPLYQPGQEFKVRGLYFDPQFFVVSGRELVFSIEDGNDTLLYREKVKTSDFGIASISWKIPENAKLGTYRVIVEADDDLKVDQLTFKVSRYDLPNFSVSAKPDKTYYLPGDDNAAITIGADYLFGKPVKNGKVRVVEERERRWNWREQKYDVTEGPAIEGTADSTGKFVAKIDLTTNNRDLQQAEWKRYEDLRFAAYFTDPSSNRTEQKRFEIRLTKEPIHIYFVRYDYQHPDLPLRGYVSTFYADGTPAFCDVEISTGKEILERFKTNSLGAGKFDIRIPVDYRSKKSLNLSVRARDKKGRLGTFDEVDYLLEQGTDALSLTTSRTIHKPGESIDVSLVSTQQKGFIYVDVAKDWAVVDSHIVSLRNGKANLTIPFRPEFKGELTIAAYTDQETYYWDSRMRSSRGVIFPEQQNLKLNAKFSNASYKPAEEAKVKFSVYDGSGSPAESALGIVVFDKAVEERAKTDAEFGNYFGGYSRFLGYDKAFGNLSVKDLNDLDLAKPISPEIELAAEVMLAGNYYYPHIYHGGGNGSDAESLYKEYFSTQLNPVASQLRAHFEKTNEFPNNDAALRRILSQNSVDAESLKDPWGNPYYVNYGTERTLATNTFKTSGPDKIRDNADDFVAASVSVNYFQPVGAIIDKAVSDFHLRTGSYVRDLPTLNTEIARLGIDFNAIKDRWDRNYNVAFEISGRNYVIRISSLGPNGVYDHEAWRSDDFDVWKNYSDYFYKTEAKINEVLSLEVNSGKKPFPKDEAEFVAMLKRGGIDVAEIKDGNGFPVQLTSSVTTRYVDKIRYENGKQIVTPATDRLLTFSIQSAGATASDRNELAKFSSVITEIFALNAGSSSEAKSVAFSGAKGAISGIVVDSQGAVITNASVIATDENNQAITFSARTDDSGHFLLSNLPSGKYTVRVDSPYFRSMVRMGVEVRSQNMVDMKVTLEVGAVTETVAVTADASLMSQTSSAVATNVTRSSAGVKISFPYKDQTSTPRLREYFPETLVWQPELKTDKKGRAEMSFKMADNITTWKMYTIASTKKGKIGIAENDIVAFQPFFVDLDPPKFLTTGDEIYLPTQVRNYTDKKQNVNVTMANAGWFTFLGCGGATTPVQSPLQTARRNAGGPSDASDAAVCDPNGMRQTTAVNSGETENTIFGFKAVTPIKEGKQRVTAMAQTDSDAIERPVTVRPDGREIVHTESRYFTGSEKFNVDFPMNTLPNTQTAELKIYPNLMAHVAESVEGLLHRPYGCGEQTISSTYPNLMILKFAGGTDGKPRRISGETEKKARKFLQSGYERLLGYQVADGGISYWGGKDSADLALTAYALRFFADASRFIEVDPVVVKKAQDWLIRQQRPDGSWNRRYNWETVEDQARAKTTTTYVARTLAMLKTSSPPSKGGVASASDDGVVNGRTASEIGDQTQIAQALTKALDYLKLRNAEIDDPYSLSLFGLAALDGGDDTLAKNIAQKLSTLTKDESGAAYWNLESNTAFNGWGLAGRVETTALVTQLFIRLKAEPELVSKAMIFLLKNKDRYGVWYSTQTTINVLDAFVASLAASDQTGTQTVQVMLNGQAIKSVEIGPDKLDQIVVDLGGKLGAGNNLVELKTADRSPLMTQVVSNHYISWQDADASGRTVDQSRALRLDYKCDRANAAIMQEVACSVEAERIGYRGYGMLLAEIGTPPGADVSRESLEAAMEADWSISRYDILPDRIVLYMWSKAGGTKFNFKFKPRYGINAQTPASTVYDYYNPEAQATIAPLRFNVK